jgi:hypothetical protein
VNDRTDTWSYIITADIFVNSGLCDTLFNRGFCIENYTGDYKLRNCLTKVESLEVTNQVGKISGLFYSNVSHRPEK